MKNPFKLIGSFLFGLTPAGKKRAMYARALNNFKEKKALSQLEKRELQSRVNFYSNRMRKSPILKSGHHLEMLVIKKFGKEIQDAGLKLNRSNFKLENA